eukprot:c14941_g1_i1 orf=382-954(+)
MGESRASWFLIVVILVIDLIAFGLAVGAEHRRAKATVEHDETQTYTFCAYDSDIATGFGVGALLFLLSSQVLITAATRCLCGGPALKPGGARAFAIIFCILAWLSFVIAEACLLGGSVRNAKHTRYRGIFGGNDISCETLRKGTFAAGAAFIFFSFILNVCYYLCYTNARGGSWGAFNKADAGVGMASYR